MGEAEITGKSGPARRAQMNRVLNFYSDSPGWNPCGPWVFTGGPLHRVGEAEMKVRGSED